MGAGFSIGEHHDHSTTEFESLAEVANEVGRHEESILAVRRVSVATSPAGGGIVSGIQWGTDPEIAFLHGGGQNAHTWDLTAAFLAQPCLALDLPGHGHSDWRDDRDYGPWLNADAVSHAIDTLAPGVRIVIGMSLGGLTTIRLARERPDLVEKAVVIDVTPGVHPHHGATSSGPESADLLHDQATFESFEDMVESAVRMSPRRTVAAVRRGVMHNALRRQDGNWVWRHDFSGSSRPAKPVPYSDLWEDLESLTIPVLFVLGAASSYVSDEDIARVRRRTTNVHVARIPDAGHAVQSDQPEALVQAISQFISLEVS